MILLERESTVMTKIKVCGLTSPREAQWLLEEKIEFAGVVLFYPKSRRNTQPEQAKVILEALGEGIQKVAVVVSPTVEQVRILQELPFDYIQIHGTVSPEVVETLTVPFWRAFSADNMQEYEIYQDCRKCAGYVFDALTPGSGKTFDWKLIPDIPRGDKLFLLAGGLSPANVAEAVRYVLPDGVDVSSGVERQDGKEKDPDKIRAFAKAVRQQGIISRG